MPSPRIAVRHESHARRGSSSHTSAPHKQHPGGDSHGTPPGEKPGRRLFMRRRSGQRLAGREGAKGTGGSGLEGGRARESCGRCVRFGMAFLLWGLDGPSPQERRLARRGGYTYVYRASLGCDPVLRGQAQAGRRLQACERFGGAFRRVDVVPSGDLERFEHGLRVRHAARSRAASSRMSLSVSSSMPANTSAGFSSA